MYRILFILAFLMVVPSAFAQRLVRQATREGNNLFHKEDFLNAEIQYRKALEVAPNDSLAGYNLGNALIHQQQDEKAKESLQQFVNAASAAQKGGNRALASKAFFNAGDVCMAAQQYQEAVQFFKRSLRNNPLDDEARYNLLLAQKLLQQQQDENQDQDKDDQQQEQQQQQDQQQQNQDQQNQNQDQQQQDPPQDQEQQPQDQQQQPQQQGQMSQDQAEAILNANNRDEQQTQEKVQQQQMQQMQRRKTSKDW